MTDVVILAGGAGQRMGGNKPFHPHAGTTLIEATLARISPQADDICINAGRAGSVLAIALESLGLPLLFDDDDYADLGPLSGVLTALNHAADKGHDAVITTPCDMPHLPSDMVSQLLARRADFADVAHFSGIRDYPLCALWKVSARHGLKAALMAAQASGGLPVMRFLRTLWVRKIVVSDDAAFANINTPQDQDHV